jgi:hypothetical protein
MRPKYQCWSVLMAAVLVGLVGVTAVAAGGEQFLPVLSAPEGTNRSFAIPRANGYIAYLTLLNARGIGGKYNLFLPGGTVALVSLPQVSPLQFTLLEGKHTGEALFTGSW